MPVYTEKEDHIVGILHHARLSLEARERRLQAGAGDAAAGLCSETAHLDTLFTDMQKSHNHMVVVVNEYGGRGDIVTMEDILEELVGEIWDERDEVVEISKTGEKHTVLCSAFIEDFLRVLLTENTGEIWPRPNGWLAELTGSILKVGYTFDYQGLTITVTKADGLMAKEISVQVNSPAAVEKQRNKTKYSGQARSQRPPAFGLPGKRAVLLRVSRVFAR